MPNRRRGLAPGPGLQQPAQQHQGDDHRGGFVIHLCRQALCDQHLGEARGEQGHQPGDAGAGGHQGVHVGGVLPKGREGAAIKIAPAPAQHRCGEQQLGPGAGEPKRQKGQLRPAQHRGQAGEQHQGGEQRRHQQAAPQPAELPSQLPLHGCRIRRGNARLDIGRVDNYHPGKNRRGNYRRCNYRRSIARHDNARRGNTRRGVVVNRSDKPHDLHDGWGVVADRKTNLMISMMAGQQGCRLMHLKGSLYSYRGYRIMGISLRGYFAPWISRYLNIGS